MALTDNIDARLSTLNTELKTLDASYQAARKDLLTKINDLTEARTLVTPEIQAAIDKLGAVIQLGS